MGPHAYTLAEQLAADPEYPSSDGKPMAENTEQARWIILLGENMRLCLPDDFVASDLLWYPVHGHPEICSAPDLLVAIGRPPGPRMSYRTWREDGVNPQVVMEVWSESNDARDKAKRLRFFEDHGVEEVYAYDPPSGEFTAWWRRDGKLSEMPVVGSVVSPLLGVRFEPGRPEMRVYGPDGARFLTTLEREARRGAAEAAASAAEAAASAAEAAASAAEAAASAAQASAEADRRARAEAESARWQAESEVAALKARLRALGLEA